MGYELILVEKEERVTIITINRPEVLNALSAPTTLEMDTALNEFDADPDSWICIVTGAGDRAFSAGWDLKWVSEHGLEKNREIMAKVKGGLGGLTRRYDCNKPLIAAVNGLAFGGGFELVLACDIIVAVEEAVFSLSEPKVGIMAAEGGVMRLPRRIPYHVAMGMILTGRRMPAREALQWGLVNEVVSREDLMSAAERWAAMMLECAPLALRASKEATLAGLEMPLEEAMPPRIFPAMDVMNKSEDAIEGRTAFVEKRKPVWKGR